MGTRASLEQDLYRLDGQSYPAYKSIRGEYSFPDFTLSIDHVQGDPFAAPSRVRVFVPQAVTQFPPALYDKPVRAIALADYLTRQFDQAIRRYLNGSCRDRGSTDRGSTDAAQPDRHQQRESGKSGLIAITTPSQIILPRTAAQVTQDRVELRFVVGLPAFGRRIAGRQAADLLCGAIPKLVHQALVYASLAPKPLAHHIQGAEDADCLRSQLAERGLVAFIADGAILPRRSGVDDRPLLEQAVPFRSPDSLRVTLERSEGEPVSGMGIPEGVTLIVGGGYHGKSTLLRAIEMGVYSHIPGDGRERVVTHPAAMKIRAEDGRSVVGVDISPFINNLPQGRSTQAFSTANASGSTSQAANIIEALEAGAKVLLLDEDTSATNFMIRDRAMQALIAKDREPITPFLDKVRQLYTDHRVSTLLVMGGSGDYFGVADTVIALDNYQPQDVTVQAREIAAQYQTGRQPEGGTHFGPITCRTLLPTGIDPRKGRREISLKVRDVDEIRFGTEEIDLSAVAQLAEPAQVQAIAAAIVYAQRHYVGTDRGNTPPGGSGQTLTAILAAVMADVERFGLDCLEEWPTGNLAGFRPLELAAAINRLRTLQVQQP